MMRCIPVAPLLSTCRNEQGARWAAHLSCMGRQRQMARSGSLCNLSHFFGINDLNSPILNKTKHPTTSERTSRSIRCITIRPSLLDQYRPLHCSPHPSLRYSALLVPPPILLHYLHNGTSATAKANIIPRYLILTPRLQAQTPQQRRANLKFAKVNEARMGKSEEQIKKRTKEVQKSPISPIWLSTNFPCFPSQLTLEGQPSANPEKP
jgi:hypothetical protein